MPGSPTHEKTTDRLRVDGRSSSRRLATAIQAEIRPAAVYPDGQHSPGTTAHRRHCPLWIRDDGPGLPPAAPVLAPDQEGARQVLRPPPPQLAPWRRARLSRQALPAASASRSTSHTGDGQGTRAAARPTVPLNSPSDADKHGYPTATITGRRHLEMCSTTSSPRRRVPPCREGSENKVDERPRRGTACQRFVRHALVRLTCLLGAGPPRAARRGRRCRRGGVGCPRRTRGTRAADR